MSKKSDEQWGIAWSREKEMDCGVALQHLAASVWVKWQKHFNAEQYPQMVGLGQVHDLWNMMYRDMKALATLEKLVNREYHTVMISQGENEKG